MWIWIHSSELSSPRNHNNTFYWYYSSRYLPICPLLSLTTQRMVQAVVINLLTLSTRVWYLPFKLLPLRFINAYNRHFQLIDCIYSLTKLFNRGFKCWWNPSWIFQDPHYPKSLSIVYCTVINGKQHNTLFLTRSRIETVLAPLTVSYLTSYRTVIVCKSRFLTIQLYIVLNKQIHCYWAGRVLLI